MFPKAEDDDITVQFEEEVILRHTKPLSFFNAPCQTLMSVDTAWSTSKFADYSCICVCRLTQVEQQDALVNTDVLMDRWKTSELIVRIVDMIYKHKPIVVVLEKDRGEEKAQEFVQDVKRMCQMRGVPAPYFALVPVAQDKKGKIVRIKRLEVPLASGRLWFAQNAAWNDQCFHQLKIFDGIHESNSSRKDDYPDALSLLWEKYGPRSTVEDISPEEKAERDAQRKRDEQEEYRYHREQGLYQAMFGDSAGFEHYEKRASDFERKPQAPVVEPTAPAKPADPRLKVFGGKGPWRI
jgi:predicted phage terminase large subunit-like protein